LVIFSQSNFCSYQALKIESKLSNVQNPADTHINACAVLSQLGRHQSALEHAQNALILLQEELLSPPGSDAAATPPQADRIAVLAIAYHNIGVEQEFLKRYEQSMLSYRKGVEVAERYLGAKHAICITLRNSLLAAKKAAAKEDSKAGGKTTGTKSSTGAKTGGAKKLKPSGSEEKLAASAEDKYEADQIANSMSSNLGTSGPKPAGHK
jgi:tetratricopeptide (TPR) repeat protein